MIIEWLFRADAERAAYVMWVADSGAPLAAAEQDARIDRAVDLLAEHPKSGRSGRKQNTRELVITGTPLIAVYRVRPRLNRIEIIRLLHGAQRWPKDSVAG